MHMPAEHDSKGFVDLPGLEGFAIPLPGVRQRAQHPHSFFLDTTRRLDGKIIDAFLIKIGLSEPRPRWDVTRRAAAVVCWNLILAEYWQRCCGKRVRVLVPRSRGAYHVRARTQKDHISFEALGRVLARATMQGWLVCDKGVPRERAASQLR